MDPGQPDVLAQVPAGGGVNKPASGTYGEGAALERLKAQLPILPQGDPQGGPAAPPPMPAPGMGGAPPPAPPGLPQALLAPSAHPGTPVSTPLQMPAPIPPSGREQAILALQNMAQDPAASEESREWAGAVLNKLIRASRA